MNDNENYVYLEKESKYIDKETEKRTILFKIDTKLTKTNPPRAS